MAQNEIANFATKQGILKENTLRLIRIGYPLLRVRANILSYQDSKNFCLIKKYLHRLVTGDQPDAKNPIAYVQDRLEAAKLLGLDKDLYDVVSYYYDELILDGLIHDSSRGALAGAAPANDPSLQRIRSSRQGQTNLTVDMFSLDIYGEKVSNLRCKTKEEVLAAHGKDICLPMPPEYVDHPETLEALINEKNFDFDNCTEEYMTARLQAQNMPHGVHSIELVQEDSGEDPVELYWLPYYLAWEKTDEGSQYCLYSNTSGKAIDLFPINEPSHKMLQDFLQCLFKGRYYDGISYALTDAVVVPLSNRKNGLCNGVTMDPDGNYHTPLTDTQFALICMSEEAEAVDVLNLIFKSVGVIPTREAGRLVHFCLTEDQRALCQKILADPQNRHALVMPLLEQNAENGDIEAIYHLANCKLMGRGTEPDPQSAFALYQKAAERKHPWALLYLGNCYCNGYGTTADLDAAIACWKELDSRAPSYSIALHNIGTAYIRMADHFEDAASVFLQAEQRNFVSSFTAYSLGYLYSAGKGVAQSHEEAVTRYKTAAKWGHIPSLISLASCYAQGTGVEKSIPMAKKLLKEALRPCPEERLFFLGAAPFIAYPNLVYTSEELKNRRDVLTNFQQKAKDLLSEL